MQRIHLLLVASAGVHGLNLHRDELLQFSIGVKQRENPINKVAAMFRPAWQAEFLAPSFAKNDHVVSVPDPLGAVVNESRIRTKTRLRDIKQNPVVSGIHPDWAANHDA